MKRFYILAENGEILGSAASPQDGKQTVLLEESDVAAFSCPMYVNRKIVENVGKFKEKKNEEIKQAFINALAFGEFLSTALGITVDCRRSAEKNDVQNVDALIAVMIAGKIPSVDYVGVTETKTATLQQLQILSLEMKQFGLALYQKKWNLEKAVLSAKTAAALAAITW